MPRTRNRLSVAKVRSAGPGLHPDGGGLYLQCTPSASDTLARSWLYRYVLAGRERRMGLGSLEDVGLADARERADAARRLVAGGIDPIVYREQVRADGAATFKDVFEAFFATKRQTLSNKKHAEQWRSTMRTYVFPTIGERPVADITTGEILNVLSPIWFKKPETARRVLQRMEAVFKSAIARGNRERASPCIGVTQELGTRHRKVTNHRSMPYRQVPAFLADLRASSRWPATRLAFEWLILTATRSGETRLARWSEIDEAAATWTVPAERMKARRDHVIPLADRCLAILVALRAIYSCEPDDLLFPSMHRSAALSDMTLTKVLRDEDLADTATVHGFRASFKVWAAEVAHARDEVSEAALAHVVPEKVRAAYLRTTFLEARKPLMAEWANYCLSIS